VNRLAVWRVKFVLGGDIVAKFYGVNMRHIVDRVIDTEFDELRDYVETVGGVLKGKVETFKARAERRAEGMSPEAKERYFEDLAEDAIFLWDRFPALTWKTAFISSYSTFEHSLLNLCRHAGRYGGFGIDVDDIKGTGIFTAQIYLKKVCKVAFPDDTPDWQDVLQMNKIRNIFVHRVGRMKRGSTWKGLSEYQKRKAKLIEFNEGGDIRLFEGYCVDAIETFRRFFKATLAAVPDDLLRRSKVE
jgi:hypothetical protein